MNGHFSLFFGNDMIRYLYSKVNLWERMYFCSTIEDKMIYQAGCFENMVKKGTGYFFCKPCPRVKRGPGKKGDRPLSSIKWGLAPFLLSAFLKK